MTRLPNELSRRLFDDLTNRLEVYGFDRLRALNATNEARPVLEAAYGAGIAAAEGTEIALRVVEQQCEAHAERRAGEPTYDTARAVLTDLLVDVRKDLS